MIELRGVSKTYATGGQELRAVDNAILKVEKGEFLSVVGHSGSGKTTLLSLIGGLTKPDAGTVLVSDIDLWSMSDNDLAALRNTKFGFIYQFSSLISTLSVLENVLLPTTFGPPRGMEAVARAGELIERVGLSDKTDAYPSELSGGQQRRAAIARAFINKPMVILADEPTGDLDEETEAEIMALFERINRAEQVTFIVVTHSSVLAQKAARRLRMDRGVLQPA